MDDISNLKELISRYMMNHFVIGYFALYIIYQEDFIRNIFLFQITMAIVASYLLFIPARFIVRLIYGEEEDDKPDTVDKMKNKRIIYKFYHLRIFFAFFVLSILYFVVKIIFHVPESKRIYLPLILFFFVILSDFFAYKFTKWTQEPGLKNRIINKLIQWFDP